MRLKKITIADFRNICQTCVEPGGQFNLFYGLNGQGKTNFLEAVYLLGNTRSFRSNRLHEYVQHGQIRALIRGEVVSGGTSNRIKVIVEPGGRRTEIEGKNIHRASELHGKLTAVVFSPDDTGMIRNGPEDRRRYLDRAVYQSDSGYLQYWHDYYRILKQRNQLLKNADRNGLDIWTEKLAEAGAGVITSRQRFVSLLDGELQRHYTTISGGSEVAGICYKPEGITSTKRSDIQAELLELFNRHQRSDERLCTTTAGPHRDDLQLFLDSRPLKPFGSQGQQKTFILALKMAEMDHLQGTFGEPPLLLLDDMTSELDTLRNNNLMDFLMTRNIQVFITTTERSPALLGAGVNCSVFRVEDGKMTHEESERA